MQSILRVNLPISANISFTKWTCDIRQSLWWQQTRISSSVSVFSSRNISPRVSSTLDTHSIHKEKQICARTVNEITFIYSWGDTKTPKVTCNICCNCGWCPFLLHLCQDHTTLCSEKNTLTFFLYLCRKCLDFHKIFSECSGENWYSSSIKVKYSLLPVTSCWRHIAVFVNSGCYHWRETFEEMLKHINWSVWWLNRKIC